MTLGRSDTLARFLVKNGEVTSLDSIPLPKNVYLATLEVFEKPISLKKGKRSAKKKRGRS
jgi:hypothetical protein